MDSNIDSAFSLLAFCVVFLGIRIRSTSPIFAEKRCISFISYIKPQQAFSSMTLPNICFNPRTHTGCDNSYYSQYLGGKSFQSTHPHGVRPTINVRHWTINLFQSTHPHGVRRGSSLDKSFGKRGFNPRTHTGCDRCSSRLSVS